MLRVSEGDEASFKMLVDIHWPRVFGSVLALTQKPETAEELTQDIFLKLWNQRQSLPSIGNLGAYLYITGRNQVVSALRKRILELAGEVPESLREEAPTPEQQLELKELQRFVTEAIEQLPPVRKKVFKMSRTEGLSYDEIAGQLSISRNTVRDHMVAALNFLRCYMQKITDKAPVFIPFLPVICFFSEKSIPDPSSLLSFCVI